MLIQFSFENFKSFRDQAVLDMSATRLTEFAEHVKAAGRERILPVAAIFGANASGKSNVLAAFDYMKHYVLHSFSYGGSGYASSSEKAVQIPFKLDSEHRHAESVFETYYTDPEDQRERVWNYGFAITSSGVQEEWLNVKAKTAREAQVIFWREKGQNDFKGIPKKYHKALQASLNDETLLVSLGSKMRVDILTSVFEWFRSATVSMDFADAAENLILSSTVPKEFASNQMAQREMIRYLHSFDMTIEDLKVKKSDTDPDRVKIDILHKAANGKKTWLSFGEEAAGTRKMFAMYSKVQETIRHGGVLLIDELNAKLHPLLVRNFLSAFLDPKKNPYRAQLIFTSHEPWLLEAGLLRRDEIWFTEKDDNGVSSLYSLAEFRDNRGTKIRKDASLAKQYLFGKFGGVPDLEPMDLLGER